MTSPSNCFSQPCTYNTSFLCSGSHIHHANSHSSASSVLATSDKGHQKSQVLVTADHFSISNQGYAHVGSYASLSLSTAMHSAVEPFTSTIVAAPASAIPTSTPAGPPTAKQLVSRSAKKGNQRNHRICHKAFSQRSSLCTNLHTHTGEKPYRCDSCSKTFSQHSNLLVHLRTHTGEKPYHCDSCGKDFSQYHSLCDHLRTHTGEKPFHCDSCGKAFRQLSALRTHLCAHTGEKPFHCDSCGKDFSRRYTLRVHIMRAHTGEKPFHCDSCGKDFSQRYNLRVHIMRAHKGKKPLHGDSAGCKKDSSAQKHAASKEPS